MIAVYGIGSRINLSLLTIDGISVLRRRGVPGDMSSSSEPGQKGDAKTSNEYEPKRHGKLGIPDIDGLAILDRKQNPRIFSYCIDDQSEVLDGARGWMHLERWAGSGLKYGDTEISIKRTSTEFSNFIGPHRIRRHRLRNLKIGLAGVAGIRNTYVFRVRSTVRDRGTVFLPSRISPVGPTRESATAIASRATGRFDIEQDVQGTSEPKATETEGKVRCMMICNATLWLTQRSKLEGAEEAAHGR
ncbi:hypothetical protein DFH07DRAFT_781201 [Mycena maculata]|uniref:Uncharacterized protein n=1 Tax=Mycena maculata TaxID=230809 RepID=A0AAD7MT95_9AGAR|nr:hypothetical protein DFH07DRAFT_781201 [Mycena maculata]